MRIKYRELIENDFEEIFETIEEAFSDYLINLENDARLETRLTSFVIMIL